MTIDTCEPDNSAVPLHSESPGKVVVVDCQESMFSGPPTVMATSITADVHVTDVGKLLNHKLTAEQSILQLQYALTRRLVPEPSKVPCSKHKHYKQVIKRYLGRQHFDKYQWLTLSEEPGYQGA